MNTALLSVVLAAVGGGAGSALRYGVDTAIRARWSRPFPVATFAVNVTGSLGLGLLVGLVGGHAVPVEVVALLGAGLLGGYTTFSTTSHETVALARAGRWRTAVGYGVGSMTAAWAAAALGLWLAG